MKLSQTGQLQCILICLCVAAESVSLAATATFKITAVEIIGNEAYSRRQLYQVMLSRPSQFLNPSFFHQDIFLDDLRSIEAFYQQNGYLEAKVVEYRIEVDSTGQTVQLHLHIAEGELTHVEGVSVFGNHAFDDEVLHTRIKMRPDDPFQRKKIEDATVGILTLYADEGYLDAEVNPDVRVDTETHRALIDFTIEEGVRSRIAQVKLQGLEKTHAEVVRRELTFHEGEVVNFSKLLTSQRQLYLTGLFQSVYVRTMPAADGDAAKRDVVIELRENVSGELNFSGGYESIEKIRGRVEATTSNWRGTARKLGVSAKASFINRGLEASFTEPWTLKGRWRTDINGFVEYLEEPGYNLNHLALKCTIGRPFIQRSSASLSFRQERGKLSDVKISAIPEKLRSNIRSLNLSLIFDTRDNLFNSTTGMYVEWSNEVAGLFLKGTNSFVRSVGRCKYFYRLSPLTVVATSLEAGWMDARGGLAAIPLQERLYTGGQNSLRGFGYQKVGPLDAGGIPTGGRLKFVWNILEVRRALYRSIGGVVFIEAGNLWEKPEYGSAGDLRPVCGCGLRVNTPIGLARLDYGFNIKRRGGEAAGMLYFSMGQAF